MVKPGYMLNVFNVFNTVLRMMSARGWRFASGKGGKSRAGHKGGKGDTAGVAPSPISSSFFFSFFFAPSRPCCGCLRRDHHRLDPQSSLGDRTGEMSETQAGTQDLPRDDCDARSPRSDF